MKRKVAIFIFFSFCYILQAQEPNRNIAFSLIGKPYKSGTLDIHETEQLVINLNQFDCVTFVESVTALAACGSESVQDSPCFRKHLQNMRYRNGQIDGYESRLHYFAEWILQNGSGTYYTDISKSLGGVRLNRTINLMSNNHDKYPLLTHATLKEIRKIENNISKSAFYYIPQEKIEAIEEKIPDFSLIACVSSRKDIITAHTGFAVHSEGKLKMLHASSSQKKVVISEYSLSEYILKNKSMEGIIVLQKSSMLKF